MKKVVRLNENQLTELIEKIVKESEEDFFDEFTIEPHVGKQPREKEIEAMFGRYEEQIPNDILRYMRKNPQLIMDKMARIYGDEFINYAKRSYDKFKKKKK